MKRNADSELDEKRRAKRVAEFIAAALLGRIEEAKAMLKRTPRFFGQDKQAGLTPLHRAAQGRNVRLVQALLACGADVRARTKEESVGVHDYLHAEGEETPLHLAVRARRAEIAELLLGRKADPPNSIFLLHWIAVDLSKAMSAPCLVFPLVLAFTAPVYFFESRRRRYMAGTGA